MRSISHVLIENTKANQRTDVIRYWQQPGCILKCERSNGTIFYWMTVTLLPFTSSEIIHLPSQTLWSKQLNGQIFNVSQWFSSERYSPSAINRIALLQKPNSYHDIFPKAGCRVCRVHQTPLLTPLLILLGADGPDSSDLWWMGGRFTRSNTVNEKQETLKLKSL